MTSMKTSTRPIGVAAVAADARVRTGLRHLLTSGAGTVVVESHASDSRPGTTVPVVGTGADVAWLDLNPAIPENHLEQLGGADPMSQHRLLLPAVITVTIVLAWAAVGRYAAHRPTADEPAVAPRARRPRRMTTTDAARAGYPTPTPIESPRQEGTS